VLTGVGSRPPKRSSNPLAPTSVCSGRLFRIDCETRSTSLGLLSSFQGANCHCLAPLIAASRHFCSSSTSIRRTAATFFLAVRLFDFCSASSFVPAFRGSARGQLLHPLPEVRQGLFASVPRHPRGTGWEADPASQPDLPGLARSIPATLIR
jgi:hypothetical protein